MSAANNETILLVRHYKTNQDSCVNKSWQDQYAFVSLSILDEDNNVFNQEYNIVINNESIPEADKSQPREDNYTTEAFDGYINMEIGLPCGDNGKLPLTCCS